MNKMRFAEKHDGKIKQIPLQDRIHSESFNADNLVLRYVNSYTA